MLAESEDTGPARLASNTCTSNVGWVEWQARWQITIRWDHAENSPVGAVSLQRHCITVAELRFLIDRARADQHVVAFPYKRVRVLVGDEPTECVNGHSYRGGSATRPKRDWRQCSCGGHLVNTCRECGDVRVDPQPGDGCDAKQPRQ